MARFDMELLAVFEEIYSSGSITRAAENLGMAQPTASIALSRLRRHFGDPLFIRTPRGMEPTPHALEILGDVRAATAALHSALRHKKEFAPQHSEREFNICMTDISEIVLLPTLLNHLKQVAPGIRIDATTISPETPMQLASGEVDLAVGFMPHLEAGFYQQKLFDQNFVCLLAADHPRIADTMTRKAFLNEGHVLIKSSGTGHSIVEKSLNAKGIERRIVLRVPSFLGVARIVAQTECIATVPQRFGSAMVQQENVKMLPPPVKLPDFSVKQHWHERFHADPANQWLRKMVAQLFLDRD
jgi:DNA-binding transcriptional LysR family regulator